MKRNLILRRRRSGDTILKLEEKKPERPCKPSFVPAMLLASGEHSSRALVTQKPHQRADPRALDGQSTSLTGMLSYWLLLQVGFAVPAKSP